MNSLTEKEISKYIYELSEGSIYQLIEKLDDTQGIDQSLVYCFIKAFYLHTAKLYSQSIKLNWNFEDLYSEHKQNLKDYYKVNNPNIEDGLMDYILNFFDNSFALIQTIEFREVKDSYEFRHYVIRVFELLRIVLENKSKSVIRENIFEDYTKIVVEQSNKIFDYLKNKN